KPGTDDLRESPVIPLIQRLWQDGFDIRVHDPDIRLGAMLGANRDFLERQLPQIERIFREELSQALEGVEGVIVTQRRPEFQAAVEQLPEKMKILDLVRLTRDGALLQRPNYEGMSW